MGSAGAPKTTPLPSTCAPPDNCSCVHSICCRVPARPPPVWIRTALCLTLFFGCLLTCQSVHACTPTAPHLRLHSCGNARTRDCGALTALTCAHCPLEPHLIPQSRSQNPTQILVPTRPRRTTGEGHWLNPDLVGKWSHSPALPFPQHA